MKYIEYLYLLSLQIQSIMSLVTLPPLPYAYNALEPHISERTLYFHHDKHHKKYVDTTNELIKDTELQNANLVDIIKAAQQNGNQQLFNNAGQSWNHEFYWNCMTPDGGGSPTGPLLDMLVQTFGSFEQFQQSFTSAGTTLFGSGWVWLVWTASEGLKIMKTKDGDAPFAIEECVPLLTMDVWEHAYYLDYQNVRANYVDGFVKHLINWNFVQAQVPLSTAGK